MQIDDASHRALARGLRVFLEKAQHPYPPPSSLLLLLLSKFLDFYLLYFELG